MSHTSAAEDSTDISRRCCRWLEDQGCVGWDFVPVDECHDEAAYESHDCHAEEQRVVALNLNPKDGQMADNRRTKGAEGEDTASPTEARGEKQQ